MKLYRTKIPEIARDAIAALTAEEFIEVNNREEAERDLEAIMDEFSRRDSDFRNRIRDYMSNRRIPYNEYGQVRKRMAEQFAHPVGEDIERFLCRQFVENMMISRFVDEVYAEDRVIYRKLMEVLRSHDVDEREIREEAATKVKNVTEGTVDYEIALQNAMREVRKRRGLL